MKSILEVSQDLEIMKQGVVEMFKSSSGILPYLSMEDINGGALKYSVEAELPAPSFRGFNEAFQQSTGKTTQKTETLSLFGTVIQIDRAMLELSPDPNSLRVRETKAALKALALGWERTFIKGMQGADGKQFDGLQVRLVGDQRLSASSISGGTDQAGGTPLSLSLLDAAIDNTNNPTALLMSAEMRRLLTQSTRSSLTAGGLAYTLDDLGRPVYRYNGLPIIVVGTDDRKQSILSFNEACPNGVGGSSIYVVSFDTDGVVGITNGGIRVSSTQYVAPWEQMEVSWYTSVVMYHPSAATRIWGIKNAPVTL